MPVRSDEGRPWDDELAAAASALGLIARNAVRLFDGIAAMHSPRFFDRPEAEWMLDNDTNIARMDSVYIRGRWLSGFLLNAGRKDEVKASDYRPGWHLPEGELRERLERHRDQSSTVIAHLLHGLVNDAVEGSMPRDLIQGFTLLLVDLPDGHPLRGLDEAVGNATSVLAASAL